MSIVNLSLKRLTFPSATITPSVCFMLTLAIKGGFRCCCNYVQLRDFVFYANISCYSGFLPQ